MPWLVASTRRESGQQLDPPSSLSLVTGLRADHSPDESQVLVRLPVLLASHLQALASALHDPLSTPADVRAALRLSTSQPLPDHARVGAGRSVGGSSLDVACQQATQILGKLHMTVGALSSARRRRSTLAWRFHRRQIQAGVDLVGGRPLSAAEVWLNSRSEVQRLLDAELARCRVDLTECGQLATHCSVWWAWMRSVVAEHAAAVPQQNLKPVPAELLRAVSPVAALLDVPIQAVAAQVSPPEETQSTGAMDAVMRLEAVMDERHVFDGVVVVVAPSRAVSLDAGVEEAHEPRQ